MALARGSLSPEALTEQCLARQAAAEPHVHAFTQTLADRARADAAAAGERRRAGREASVLDGVPLAIKDNFCVAGTRTTASSKMLRGS